MPISRCKGANWIDYDNDDYPDLFVDYLDGDARLYHNNRNGTFTDVTSSMGIDGPRNGFSCWAWDYDNDGWLDIFATCYDYSLEDVVKGLIGQPHGRLSNRLFHNLKGKGFEDKTKEAGLDLVFMTMGSNFGDFDNDGFLDMYLGTGDPDLTSLVPNRMFKNVAGQRFAEITASSGTGNLQKGHGVSCADWDRDGDIDLFIEMGGAIERRSIPQHPLPEPRPGEPLVDREARRQKDQPAGHRRPDQGRHGRRTAADDPPPRLLGQQLGGEPTPANHRPGQGRPGCRPGDPLADQRDDPGVPRHRRGPGHRGDRAYRHLPDARLEADPGGKMKPTFVLVASSLVLAFAFGWTFWRARRVADRRVPFDEKHTAARPRSPWKNTQPNVKYVGDSACARCHAEIADTFRRHPMGRSLAPIAARDDRPDSTATFDANASRYTVEGRAGRVIHREARLDKEGRVLAQVEGEVKYEIGSAREESRT